MRIRMSGWKRLWIFVSLGWLVVFTVLVLDIIPSPASIRADWVTAILKLHLRYNGDKITLKESRAKYFDGYGDNRQFVSRITSAVDNLWETYNRAMSSKLDEEEAKRWNDFKTSEPNLSARFEDFHEEFQQLAKTYGGLFKAPWIISRIGIFLGIWVISISVVYTIGWGIGWVYRGFRTLK